jgi:hypothetical protein
VWSEEFYCKQYTESAQGGDVYEAIFDEYGFDELDDVDSFSFGNEPITATFSLLKKR